MNNKVIYTAVFGGYDRLNSPEVITPGWDYICFTDTESTDNFPVPWKTIRITSSMSPVKMSKTVKILWYQFVGMYNLSIWIDGSLTIICNLDWFVAKYHKGNFTLMKHPGRDCIYDEGALLIREKIMKAQIVNEQLDRYKKEGFPSKYGLTANGVMIRAKTLDHTLFELWWQEVKNYCPRDQLSFMYAHWKNPTPLTLMPYNIIFNNEFRFTKHGK